MFGKIKFTKSIYKALSYNEQKLSAGRAECLLAENFIKDIDQLSIEDKLDRFHRRNSLNDRSKCKTLHCVLSFSDKDIINDQQMKTVARRYMEAVGLAEEPYLVYRHYDSAQPHLHIIGTNIRADGSRIIIRPGRCHEMQKKMREWETEFSLERSERVRVADEQKYKVKQASKVIYGQRSLHRSISDVLHVVIEQYRFTSFSEFNALLRCYNVRAYRGKETSRLYRNKGLLYYAIDEKGARIGKSIRASSFLLKPTLANLEQRFVLNRSLCESHRTRLTNAIDWLFVRGSMDLAAFRAALQKARITTVMQKDKAGQPIAIWYIDQTTNCVFDGADMGGRYTVQAIQQRCISEQAYKELERLRAQELQQDRSRGRDYSISL